VTKNRLVLSDAAVVDIVEQADWYTTQSGKALAQRWEDAVTSAILRTLHRSHTGAPCHFQAAELHDLRRTAIAGFPKHLLFYRFDRGVISVSSTAHVIWKDFFKEGAAGVAFLARTAGWASALLRRQKLNRHVAACRFEIEVRRHKNVIARAGRQFDSEGVHVRNLPLEFD
jgi:plasmid stabilization system protein ParE